MRIVPLSELYDRIEWPVVVLLGSMIPLGAALETSGGTALIADGLVTSDRRLARLGDPDGADGGDDDAVGRPQQHRHGHRRGARGDHHGGAADGQPRPVPDGRGGRGLGRLPHAHRAQEQHADPGPGGYRFGDYWRMGLPLEVLIIAVSIPALLVFWPL
jgi:hypothetical protein